MRPIPWHAWGPMEAALRVGDWVPKTVVFIGREHRGQFIPEGTGFITATLINANQAWQTIVTAKHVIDSFGDTHQICARLNGRDGKARLLPMPKAEWHFHEDPEIDVAVFPTAIDKDVYEFEHFRIADFLPPDSPVVPKNFTVNPKTIAQYDIGIGDDLYMPGLFVQRMGETTNIPIIRIGTIAAMSGEKIQTKYGHHEAFLAELRSIDGLSGSPVCIDLPISRTLPPNIRIPMSMTGMTGYLLLGMVLGYNEVYNPRDKIEIEQKSRRGRGARRVLVPVPVNTGIAVVLPIWKVLEAMEQPKIQQMRRKALSLSNREKGGGFVPSSVSSESEDNPDENPDYREDFMRLVGAASKRKPKGDRT